jgi:carboxylesterase type B
MEDVIVVTINYRLHYAGFACIPEMGIHGNAGLKDQQMALEWIHENIEYFGGDKTNITLFGASAGGGSAHVHTLNAKSRQYFHKIINMSWNSFGDYFLQHNPREKTRKTVELLKGRTDTPKDIYETLMKTDIKDIFKLRLKIQEPYEKRRNFPIILKPHIEEESDDAFLTKLPIDILREEGSKINIPTMSGITNGEGIYQILHYVKIHAKTDHELYRFIPMTLNVDPVSSEGEQFAKEMRSYFLGTRGFSKETFPLVREFFTDINFRIPTVMCAELIRKFSPQTKQYFYEFGLESKLNYWKQQTPLKNLPGVMHADELSYLFE